MTSVQYGGGPNLEERRFFAGLKDGTQIPGYRGFIPQLKYRNGKTYGEDTHELLTNKDARPELEPIPPPHLILPKPNGDNKLTEKMVPGYSGYIPRRPFKFGDTYKVDCDICIDDHMRNMKINREKSFNFKITPPLVAQSFDPYVANHLNTYKDTHPRRPILKNDKRESTEPPIPGYKGYIPRIAVTELGLGERYSNSTYNGLNDFYCETERRRSSKSVPVRLNFDNDIKFGNNNRYSKRIFVNSGMIPNYTGHCHQRRYQIGQNYGDTTRSLEVCKHPMNCYGEFNKTKRNEHCTVESVA